MEELILILDFGGQYNQLIARRVRELNVYSMIKPFSISINEIKKINPKGIIFTGGPSSIYEKDSPKCDEKIPLFGDSHLDEFSKKLDFKVLGKLPIVSENATKVDNGKVEEVALPEFDSILEEVIKGGEEA